MGLLYNWYAASNSKNIANDDGENSATPQREKRQGICPNGWHLPSDAEWTLLEKEINSNTSKYAGLPDINAGISPATDETNVYRGTLHGKAMKDSCEPFSGTHQGASNPISEYNRAGFGAMLTGWISTSGNASGYGGITYFHTSSKHSSIARWARYLYPHESKVIRGRPQIRSGTYNDHFAVRCKKDEN